MNKCTSMLKACPLKMSLNFKSISLLDIVIMYILVLVKSLSTQSVTLYVLCFNVLNRMTFHAL